MTTKTIIRTSTTSTTGYEIVIGDVTFPIDEKVPTKKGDDFSLVLPENPSNRKFIAQKKVDIAGGELELTFKASNPIGPRHRPLEEYMTEDELELKYQYEKMLDEVAQRRRADEEAQKNDKPKSKTKAELMAELEALQMELAKMKEEA